MTDLIMRKMEMLALGQSDSAPITRLGEHPPCFDSLESYRCWLDACDNADATGVPLPKRRHFPKEPNYCRECSREHRNEMRQQGRCLFPSTRFVEEGEGEETELVGEEP